MNIQLSIIVPIFNVENYLIQCIESLLAQTFTFLEIVLVNDGSTDNSLQICEFFRDNDSRIKLVNKENGGVVSARKAGLRVATGKYIGFVDGDDWVEPKFCEKLMFYAEKYCVDIVIGGHKEEVEGVVTEVLFNNFEEGYYNDAQIQKEIIPQLIFKNGFSNFGVYSYVWNKVFKKTLIESILKNLNDKINIAEDAAISYPAILNSKNIYIAHTAEYRYRQRTDSMVKTTDPTYLDIKKFATVYKHLYSIFNRVEKSDVLINQLHQFMVSLICIRYDLNPILFGHQNNHISPFGHIPTDNKIAIVGAGTFGQHLMRRIMHNNNYTIAGWFDDYYSDKTILGVPVFPLNKINKKNANTILVAYINEKTASRVHAKIIQSSFRDAKIMLPVVFQKLEFPKIINALGLHNET
jgi:glycosyltransferase involved in cell wall biosynthesis